MACYYGMGLARFSQVDPVFGEITDPITLNAYQYAGCDPANNVDPSGLFFEEAFAFVMSQFLGGLVGGSVAVACWGVAAYFTAGTALGVASVACYAAGRIVTFTVANAVRDDVEFP